MCYIFNYLIKWLLKIYSAGMYQYLYTYKFDVLMLINEFCCRYQKKIGSYDKQLWEKTLEQKILHGLTHIQMKSAKPKTDLIDLDLVRGEQVGTF